MSPSPTDRVRNAVAEALQVEQSRISDDATLIGDLGAESLDLLEVMYRLEQEFGVELPRGEIERNARGELTELEFAPGGVLTGDGLIRLRRVMPEVRADAFVPGLRVQDIPRLMTVATLRRIVEEQLARSPSPTDTADKAVGVHQPAQEVRHELHVY
jgi:acyl carrier protein